MWTRRGAGLLVVLVAVAVLSPTLVFRTVQYDDHWLWSDSSPLRQLDAATLHDVFFELDRKVRRPLGGEYLPVRDVVVAVDMAIWGELEQGPHVTQLLLFALTVWGLGTLLIRFGLRREIAWVGTLLWAIHPIHVESVAWLSERKGVLAGLFVIACGHAWVRYRQDRSWAWLVLAALCAVAGVWSKAPAMFAPAAFAAWDLLLLPRTRRRWIAIVVVGGVAALAAVPVVLVAREARVIEDGGRAYPAGRAASVVGAHGHYAQSLALAKRPTISYPIQTHGPSPLDLALGALVLAGSLALCVHARRRPSDATAWQLALLAWAWIWFVPIGHVLVRVHILVADRFAYLWSVAGCVAVAWLLERVPGRLRVAATGTIVCVLGIATLRAQEPWTASTPLFTRAIETNPDDAAACENLALALGAEGRIPRAFDVIDRCLETRPDHSYLWQRKAVMLWAIGRRAEALEASRRSTATGFSSASALYAQHLHALGRAAEAVPWAERAVQRRPENAGYARTLAEILVTVGRYRDAETIVRRLMAETTDPPFAFDHLLLATVLVATGRGAEAAPHLELAAHHPMFAAKVAALRARIAPEVP
ncbi:MAG: tetratricopeptide repeat protein [Myxococcota bacterium]|nr:tetratricopeptide repeat protein [Myxococcota bacterium]